MALSSLCRHLPGSSPLPISANSPRRDSRITVMLLWRARNRSLFALLTRDSCLQVSLLDGQQLRDDGPGSYTRFEPVAIMRSPALDQQGRPRICQRRSCCRIPIQQLVASIPVLQSTCANLLIPSADTPRHIPTSNIRLSQRTPVPSSANTSTPASVTRSPLLQASSRIVNPYDDLTFFFTRLSRRKTPPAVSSVPS